ncbi:multidrug MFS transporter (plasmid) [Companilactobacillus farciminis]|nr:multidrug MFS transporter [Companilactobacillus farciminis]
MEYFDGKRDNTTINLEYQDKRYIYRGSKRIFDFVASLFGLTILSPLFLIVAIAIKVEDPKGPVFYSQVRLGKKQSPFKMYKFRSMIVDADKHLKELLSENEVDGAMFKMKEDPRVTKVGHFIRKYSIDELPQLVNVLLGNMSLVGPRPPLPREVAEYTEYDKQRLAVKPGCTGLWQVSGRNNVGFKEMVELDLKYINSRGIILDIYVLLKTVIVFFRPNGAY